MNIIAESWMHCMLASHWDEDSGDGDYDPTDYIEDYLKDHYGNVCKVTMIKNSMDFGYLCETKDKVFDVTRGTDGGKAWGSNFKFIPNDEGIHCGFLEGFNKLWLAKKHHLFKTGKPIICTGHSRGGPIELLTAAKIKEKIGRYSKCITFCMPTLGTKRYCKYLNWLKIDHLRIVNPGDFVDNVGVGGVFGKHYGKKILLPKYGMFHRIPFLRHIFGHAYSSVNEALEQYFYGRGMKREAEYLKSIRSIATI